MTRFWKVSQNLARCKAMHRLFWTIKQSTTCWGWHGTWRATVSLLVWPWKKNLAHGEVFVDAMCTVRSVGIRGTSFVARKNNSSKFVQEGNRLGREYTRSRQRSLVKMGGRPAHSVQITNTALHHPMYCTYELFDMLTSFFRCIYDWVWELRGDTVHFIASSSALVLMMQNGSIYPPLTQTATCLLRWESSKHIAENS